MIRISLPYVFNLCAQLEPIESLTPQQTRNDVVFEVWSAQIAVEQLISSSVFSANLRSCRQLAEALANSLKLIVSAEKDWSEQLGYSAAALKTQYQQFKIALMAEIGTFPAYFVSQKGSFDTLSLLDEPWKLFPMELWIKVPEARFDVIEAGKALCYELPTACGMHVFRALETVLRRYYTEATGGKPQPKVRNIAVYINAMRQAGKGDPKVLGVLDHLSNLHRNPLMHPDAALTIDEAISIVGMAHSAMTAMLRHLPEPPQTTTSVPRA
ncbi:hypothetical protein ACQR13_21100 [Bradyrhizobium sp. HKCCYLRH3059]|uniref:hypothetical protein n=1 Tax=Bradyrhizobium sp. HKCCYLRH3059 TaxID=3420745 RepID=UPI003EB8B3D3